MQKRNTSKILSLLLLLTLFNLTFASAITGSIGNARMILYPEVNGWTTTTIEKTILVKNVNDVPLNITMQVDKNGEEFLELIDEEFRLEPNTEKKAEFLVKVKKVGKYEGKINVLFTPDNGTGIALSSTIIVIAKEANDYEEDENENSDDSNSSGVSVMTGGSVINNSSEGGSLAPLLLFISTLVLIAILAYLIYKNKDKLFKKNQEEGFDQIQETQKTQKVPTKKKTIKKNSTKKSRLLEKSSEEEKNEK